VSTRKVGKEGCEVVAMIAVLPPSTVAFGTVLAAVGRHAGRAVFGPDDRPRRAYIPLKSDCGVTERRQFTPSAEPGGMIR
jgi:hypothetical protein